MPGIGGARRDYPPGKRPWLKAWRYPGVRIPSRLTLRYEVKVA